MKALDVFAAVISYFKSHMLDSFTNQYGDDKYVTNEELHTLTYTSKMDSEGRLRTKLYDKRDDLIFPL
jgi:hypothetical protein